jgi:hypothetical protein
MSEDELVIHRCAGDLVFKGHNQNGVPHGKWYYTTRGFSAVREYDNGVCFRETNRYNGMFVTYRLSNSDGEEVVVDTVTEDDPDYVSDDEPECDCGLFRPGTGDLCEV